MSENLRVQAQNGAVLRGEGREEPLDLDAIEALESANTCGCVVDSRDECCCDADPRVVSVCRELRRLREENARYEAECERLEGEIVRRNMEPAIKRDEELAAEVKGLREAIEKQVGCVTPNGRTDGHLKFVRIKGSDMVCAFCGEPFPASPEVP